MLIERQDGRAAPEPRTALKRPQQAIGIWAWVACLDFLEQGLSGRLRHRQKPLLDFVGDRSKGISACPPGVRFHWGVAGADTCVWPVECCLAGWQGEVKGIVVEYSFCRGQTGSLLGAQLAKVTKLEQLCTSFASFVILLAVFLLYDNIHKFFGIV